MVKRLKATKLSKKIIWLFFTTIKPRGGPQSTKEKQELIIKLAQKNKISNFIETGTYIGETVKAIIPFFKNIYTIELNKKLYLYNKKRFYKNSKVKVVWGNSYLKLKQILPKLKRPIFFWLDAHYSGGITSKTKKQTPIEEELATIVKYWRKGSIVLIDDARLFNGKRGYPTIEKIVKIFSKKNVIIKITKDIITIE